MQAQWKKSSYSFSNGNCVECAEYRKSTHSEPNGHCVEFRKSTDSMNNANCAEVATGVQVRDSKNPDGPVLGFTPDQWRSFVHRWKFRRECRFEYCTAKPGECKTPE